MKSREIIILYSEVRIDFGEFLTVKYDVTYINNWLQRVNFVMSEFCGPSECVSQTALCDPVTCISPVSLLQYTGHSKHVDGETEIPNPHQSKC